MAVATQGCASWSRAARPAPRKTPDSRLIFQVMEFGPKMPARGSALRQAIAASDDSRSARETRDSMDLLSLALPVAGKHFAGARTECVIRIDNFGIAIC